MLWDIDQNSGHCAHGSGAAAYIDQSPTQSGAIRCTGPFGPSTLRVSDAEQLARMLTIQIENDFPSNYVVWGTHLPSVSKPTNAFQIMDSVVNFVPNLLLRAVLMKHSGFALAREWSESNGNLFHRSGFEIQPDGTLVVRGCDPQITDSQTIALLEHKSHEIRQKIIQRLGTIDTSPEIIVGIEALSY